jgi:hypothetical protein
MNLRFTGFIASFYPPVDEPDANGMKYTKESIANACEDASGIPITAYNANGEEVVIGVADNVLYEDGRINVGGRLFKFGTTEYIKQTYDLDLVTKCKFASITLC